MSTPIFVINLASSTERAKSISSQFDKLSIEFDFFDAINGKREPNHELFKKYNRNKHFLRKGRYLSKGELGCYASHYLLIKKCLELNKAIIVFEDDAVIDPKFGEFYKHIDNFIEQCEFIWLHHSFRNKPVKYEFELNEFNISRCQYEHVCATGYLITPRAAKKLLEHMDEEWIYPVDDEIARFYENKVKQMVISPSLCFQSGAESVIGEDNRKKNKHLSLYDKIRREVFNFKDKISRNWYNICN